MKKLSLLLAYLIPIVILGLCSDQEIEKKSDTKIEIEIINNSNKPRYLITNGPKLHFKKDLIIRLRGALYSFDADESGNIYILDIENGEIEAFDSNGVQFNNFGKKGQGPGEFSVPWILKFKNNQISILDKSKEKLFIFNEGGHLIRSIDTPSSIGVINNFFITPKNDIGLYYWVSTRKISDLKRIRKGIIGINNLSIFSENFERKTDIFKCDNRFLTSSSNGKIRNTIYPDLFYYQIDREGNLYCGYSSKYEIHIFSSDGKLKKIIKKRTHRISTTKQDIDNVLIEFPDLRGLLSDAMVSKTKPYFSNIFVLENTWLLVCTYEDEWNSDDLINCDLFDSKGDYIARIKIPEFYYWNNHGLITEQRNCLFKNGNCYAIVYNNTENYLNFVRYNVEIIKDNGNY